MGALKRTENYPTWLLNFGIKTPGLKFNLGLAPIGLRTTGLSSGFKSESPVNVIIYMYTKNVEFELKPNIVTR